MQTKSNGGQAPFGFRWCDGELVQEPQEASTYALIFDLFLIHQRKGTVAKLLNQRGLRTHAGKEFTSPTIKRALENPIAKGIRRISVTEANEGGERVHRFIETSVSPVVSTTVWDHVQAIFAEQVGSQTRPATQDLFIGKVLCDCRPETTQMELPSKSANYKCYSCDRTMNKNDVLAIIEDNFATLNLPSHDVLTSIANTALLDTNTDPIPLLKNVKRDIDKLFALHAKEAITDEVFKTRYSLLETRQSQLESEIEKSKTQVSFSSFEQSWQDLPNNLKRITIENLVDNITLSSKQVTVSLYSLFNFAQQATTTRG